MEPLIVRLSRWRFSLIGLLMLLFALLSFWLHGQPNGDTETNLISLGSLVLFGGMGVFLLVQAFRSKPVIVLNDAGIEDMRLKMGVIPWSEIVRAYEVQYIWYKNVQLQLRNPEQYRQKQSGLLRALGSYNKALGVSPFTLYTQYTDASAKVLVDYIYQQLLRQWPVPAPIVTTTAPLGEVGEY